MNTPDIQDIQDVDRFCRRCWYPVSRNGDGSVAQHYYVDRIDGNLVRGVLYNGDSGDHKNYTLAAFLKLEQGYYKSRLIEYGGSVIYVRNTGANEGSRNHGLKLSTTELLHLHTGVTDDFHVHVMEEHKIAQHALSTKRTTFYQAIDKLNEGEIVGAALSDNYGLITTGKSDKIQLIRRGVIIGHIDGHTPYLNKQFQHFYNAVHKVCR